MKFVVEIQSRPPDVKGGNSTKPVGIPTSPLSTCVAPPPNVKGGE